MSDTLRQVQPGDTLTLHFALRVNGDTEVDSSFGDAPITLTLGDGTLTPNLEYWLMGITPGERHVFQLDPLQAFGDYNDELVQLFPLSDFPADKLPQIDSVIEFSLPNGNTLAGRILALTETHASIDFNHLLAGLPIEFEVEVVSIA
ncbi:MAG: FKBP-type peptidyl-prolyl cis-trans isomerase [Pseudomonadota bacterium]